MNRRTNGTTHIDLHYVVPCGSRLSAVYGDCNVIVKYYFASEKHSAKLGQRKPLNWSVWSGDVFISARSLRGSLYNNRKFGKSSQSLEDLKVKGLWNGMLKGCLLQPSLQYNGLVVYLSCGDTIFFISKSVCLSICLENTTEHNKASLSVYSSNMKIKYSYIE